MRILCPHCKAIYQLPEVDADTLLVCHRCNTEFRIGEETENMQNPGVSTQVDESTPDMFATTGNASEPERTEATEQTPPPEKQPEQAAQMQAQATPTESAAPPRSKARIMPWLFGMLVVIAGSGFWFNHDAWLDDPWLRSVLLNIGVPIQVRDKDWLIIPESIDATWIKRSQNDTVLVITGEVVNRLQTDLPPPAIHFTLYARDNPDAQILERDLTITRPPLMQAIRQTPFTPPPRDTTPVSGLGKRGFVLVLENMPQNAGNFTLSATVR